MRPFHSPPPESDSPIRNGSPDAVSIAVGENPVSIAAADFNEDGVDDLVTADRDSNLLSVLISTP